MIRRASDPGRSSPFEVDRVVVDVAGERLHGGTAPGPRPEPRAMRFDEPYTVPPKSRARGQRAPRSGRRSRTGRSATRRPRCEACGGWVSGSHAISTSASAATTAVAAARWITLIGASLSSSRRRLLEACPRAMLRTASHDGVLERRRVGAPTRAEHPQRSPAVVLHLRLRVSAGFRPAFPNPSSAEDHHTPVPRSITGSYQDVVGELRRGGGWRLGTSLEEAPAVDPLILHRAAGRANRRVRPARAAQPVGPVLGAVRPFWPQAGASACRRRADQTALVQARRRWPIRVARARSASRPLSPDGTTTHTTSVLPPRPSVDDHPHPHLARPLGVALRVVGRLARVHPASREEQAEGSGTRGS